MRKSLYLSLMFCFVTAVLPVTAQRDKKLLNSDWHFRFSHEVERNSGHRVDIPHTWNAADALRGKQDYKRGIGNYTKKMFVAKENLGKRLFLHFEGAYNITNLFINGKHIGEHRGGYGAFNFEITDAVKYGQENTIWLRVNNAEQLDIMPLVGDFNFYGGIYRNVWLLTTNDACISPLNYASPGVQLFQKEVSKESAVVEAQIALSNRTLSGQELELVLSLKAEGKELLTSREKVTLSAADDEQFVTLPFEVNKPRLWNGTKDPFLYQVTVELVDGTKVIDRVEQPLGLRYFHVDPDKGFFLNGEHLKLKGVCRHQDRAEIGSALHSMHHQEDVDLIVEMGANAVRLAHYPQAPEVYDLMDKEGLIVWAEIPFIGPGGYLDKGFVDQESFKENGKQQLIELIRQHYNHPSICMWGLFNELKEDGDNPVEYIKELDLLSKKEDPYRPTTSASNQGGALNFVTDLIAWNRYDGWYGGLPPSLGKWLDATHEKSPELRIAISEYGAGASIYHQQDSLVRTVPTSLWHPENWQTYYHIENWKIISERPYVWGSFVWNMFDFGAAHRTEGDRMGINDKGLVSFDRKYRKDSFYFYKANWNKTEPLVHISGKRATPSSKVVEELMVFSNMEEVELFVNGKSHGVKHPDAYSMIIWENLNLQDGENAIEVVGKTKRKQVKDVMNFVLL